MSDKYQYRCYTCERSVIASLEDSGPVPYFTDCVFRCDGLMHRESGRVDTIGQNPEYALRREGNKLQLVKMEDDA